jgi:hypothetical protein
LIYIKAGRRARIAHMGDAMNGWSTAMKAFGWVVMALMVAAILYAAFTSLRYWPGISV